MPRPNCARRRSCWDTPAPQPRPITLARRSHWWRSHLRPKSCRSCAPRPSLRPRILVPMTAGCGQSWALPNCWRRFAPAWM